MRLWFGTRPGIDQEGASSSASSGHQRKNPSTAGSTPGHTVLRPTPYFCVEYDSRNRTVDPWTGSTRCVGHTSLPTKRVRENSINIQTGGNENASVTRSSAVWAVSLCPNLEALGFKYRRWLRQHKSDEITTILWEIVDTRAKSNTANQFVWSFPIPHTFTARSPFDLHTQPQVCTM
jgi:hypothetical protein